MGFKLLVLQTMAGVAEQHKEKAGHFYNPMTWDQPHDIALIGEGFQYATNYLQGKCGR